MPHQLLGALDVFDNHQKFRTQRRIFAVLDDHPVSIAANDGEDIIQLMSHVAPDLFLRVGMRAFGVQVG